MFKVTIRSATNNFVVCIIHDVIYYISPIVVKPHSIKDTVGIPSANQIHYTKSYKYASGLPSSDYPTQHQKATLKWVVTLNLRYEYESTELIYYLHEVSYGQWNSTKVYS